jgi:crotonobetainyl-CoA:carnitine CoA-transferase CaiB-like acyl-CoA transferase
MIGPLKGVRVLSMAEQYPGPFASLVLADLGADVVLVERPNGGDPSRRFTGHFEALNRNKRSITLDLKNAADKTVFHSLLATADVLMEGFRPGVMARLGLGADRLREKNPALIYTSISSFGHSGPLSDRGGHDILVQGLAGFVSRGANPAPAATPMADIASAMYAAIGILTALYARRSSKAGIHIDVSMLDSLVAWRSTSMVSSMNSLGPAPYPPEDPGYGVFCVGQAGELFTLSIAGEDHQWRELCLVLELDDIAGLTTIERERQAPALRDRLAEAFRTKDAADIETKLAARGVTLGKVNDNEAVALDPQIQARGIIAEVEGSPGLRVVKQPIQFDGWSGVIKRRAPKLGENTRELLTELGYTETDIERYIAAGGTVPATH